MVNSMRRSKQKSGAGGSRTKTEHSYLQSLLRVLPTVPQLLSKKYYQPIIKEEERRMAGFITYYLRGHLHDPVGLKQIVSMYTVKEHLASYRNWSSLTPILVNNNQEVRPKLGARGAFYIVRNCHARKLALLDKMNHLKKEASKSTAISSKKSLPVLDTFHPATVNDSTQLNRLARCLKSTLSKYGSKKGYQGFVIAMEKKGQEQQEHSEGMMKLILNLEKDFSSIHESQEKDFSKETIYGLSDLKKKSDRNTNVKEKGEIRLSGQGLLLKRANIGRRNRQNQHSRGLSTSKNSKKSLSTRSKKGGGTNNANSATPDARLAGKSQSRKKLVLKLPEKSNRMVDTQRLYFDAPLPVSRVEQRGQANRRQLIQEGIKSRRKGPKR